jgi:multisubunit Na+/H+ antiporter MnhF subunit
MPFVESFFEKLVFLSALSSFVVILMCMLAVIYKKEFYLDIALMYSLLSFTGMLCFAWFFKKEQIKK